MRQLVALVLVVITTMTACTGGDTPGNAEQTAVREVVMSGTGSVRSRPEGAAVVDADDVADLVFVEIGVRGSPDGGLEVGIRVNATSVDWLPEERLFDHEAAPVGTWWSSSPAGSADTGASAVRVQARRLEDGRIETALSTPSGREVLPRARFVSPDALATDRWRYSSPVVLDVTGEPVPPVPDGSSQHSGYLAISTGYGYDWDPSGGPLFAPGHGCGVRMDLTLACWGNDWDGQASPPGGEFVAVDAGWTHTCGIRVGGDVTCWGSPRGEPPGGPFVAVSAGNFHSCGIRPHGGVECWGDDSDGQSSPPEGTFTSVSAGNFHSCGLRVGDTIACWGSNTHTYVGPGEEPRFSGQAQPPGGEFSAVSAGSEHTCGIRPDGAIECWGNETYRGKPDSDGPYISVSVAGDFTCGLLLTGEATCWPRQGWFPGLRAEFVSLSAGDWGVCGIRPGGTAACWRRQNVYPPAFHAASPPPTGRFSAVSAGESHTCGIQESGTVTCWEEAARTSVDLGVIPSQDEFVAINTGRSVTCGIRVEGDLRCWGESSSIGRRGIEGRSESVSVGGTSACALRPGGDVACWGEDSAGQSSPPDGTFAALAAGGRHVCGLRSGGEVACWGDGSLGQTASPEGIFTALSAGEAHTCGLRSNGEVACWGHEVDPDHIRDNYVDPPEDAGAFDVPEGAFVALSAGAFHTCGLRAGGEAECWPSWGVEGDLDHETTFPVASIVPAFAENTGAGHFMTLGNPARPEQRQPEPGAPDSGTGDACDVAGVAEAACQWAWDHPDYSWTPVSIPVEQPRVWRDSRVDPLPGPFVALSSGLRHTCGIRPDGTIDCWSAYQPRN
ncbi:MAG: hypothetical protein OXG52_10395 [bacterium]|nr:hypothetical protein [bacterium]